MEPPTIKCVVVGSGFVGKTSLLMRYKSVLTLPFNYNEYKPTIFENSLIEVTVDDEEVQLMLYDTAGRDIVNI